MGVGSSFFSVGKERERESTSVFEKFLRTLRCFFFFQPSSLPLFFINMHCVGVWGIHRDLFAFLESGHLNGVELILGAGKLGVYLYMNIL